MAPDTPEQRARRDIDAQLLEAGWLVQDRSELNLAAGQGVAIREIPMAPGHGFADYMLFFDRKPGAKEPWTKTLWVYDLRTNMRFTLKTKRINRADLNEFVECYRPGDRHKREATWSEETPEGRWRPYGYDEIIGRDKVSLDLFWLRDESLEDSASLPEPHVLAQEIAEDLRASLEEVESILADLQGRAGV